MKKIIWNPNFTTFTPSNKYNFIGVTQKYFDEINKDNIESTNDAYVKTYEKNIFPYINTGKNIEEYTVQYIEELIQIIQEKNNYGETTIHSNIRHLMYDPVNMFFKIDLKKPNVFSINPSNYPGKESAEETLSRTVKSFTVEEEKKAAKILISNQMNEQGEYVGLAVMFYTALRNNEACGLNFSDIHEMMDHPGCYYIQVTKSTERRKRTLKSGGKTANAPRNIPVIDALMDILVKRKEYLKSAIKFPYEEGGITYKSIDELPVACHGKHYGTRCSSDDLTEVGRHFLQDEINMKKERIAALQICFAADENLGYISENDLTTYVLRRNFATHMYTLGLSTVDSQYLMGHEMQGTLLQRSDYTDEDTLYRLWRQLKNHPLNNKREEELICESGLEIDNESNINVKLNRGEYLLRVESRELNDAISIEFDTRPKDLEITDSLRENKGKEEINIVKTIRKAYR